MIDLDGVVVRGLEPIRDAMVFLRRAVRSDIPFVLVTNNATRTPQAWAELLATQKVAVAPERIITSAVAAADQLSATPPASVLVIGSEALRLALSEGGSILVDDAEKADTVVVGLDRSLSYDALSAAADAIVRGARFIATNPDRVTPTETGVAPGTGATIAFLRTATGVAPEIVGKPRPAMLALAAQRLGRADGLLFVGDQIETDVRAANEAGWDSVLVLSGIGEWDSLVGHQITPTWIVGTLGDLDGPEPPLVRPASPDELPAVEQLLSDEALDPTGAADRIKRTLVAVDHDKRIVGTVAWDLVADSAHLRGIVVEPKERGHGTGSHLVARALQVVANEGAHLAWMLTTGADSLFKGLGFYRVHRDRVPAEVAATTTLDEGTGEGRVLMRRLPPITPTNGNGTL